MLQVYALPVCPCAPLSLNPPSREARLAVCSPSLEPPPSSLCTPPAPFGPPAVSPCPTPAGPAQPLAALPAEQGGGGGDLGRHLLSEPSSAGFLAQAGSCRRQVPANPLGP